MSQPKVTLVGPFTPYRGGIAAHTTRLRQALATNCVVNAEAYRNPFPKWLYPGEHLGDLRGHADCLPGVHYDLSYLWPGAWPKVTHRILESNPDVVLIPWWTFFFGPHYARLAQRLRRAGIPVVFLCHNFFDHEAAAWKKWFSLKALRHASGFVFHSPEEQKLAANHFPKIPSLLHPHPIYDHLNYASGNKIRNNTFHLLFFGIVRPYKGLEDLIIAIEQIQSDKVHLTIAGEWWGKQSELHERCRKLETTGRVTLLNHYIPDSQAAELFSECDAVALPYRQATNSGVLAHALYARKPVIVTQTGSLPLLVEDTKTGYIVPPNNPGALSKTILKLQQRIQNGENFAPPILGLHEKLSWELFADKLESFLSDLIRVGSSIQNRRPRRRTCSQ